MIDLKKQQQGEFVYVVRINGLKTSFPKMFGFFAMALLTSMEYTLVGRCANFSRVADAPDEDPALQRGPAPKGGAHHAEDALRRRANDGASSRCAHAGRQGPFGRLMRTRRSSAARRRRCSLLVSTGGRRQRRSMRTGRRR